MHRFVERSTAKLLSSAVKATLVHLGRHWLLESVADKVVRKHAIAAWPELQGQVHALGHVDIS